MNQSLKKYLPKKSQTVNVSARLEMEIVEQVYQFLEKNNIKLKDFMRAAFKAALETGKKAS